MKTFRVRYELLGGHYHLRVFSANNPSGTFAKLGDLVMDEADRDSFKHQIGNGWQLLPEEKREREESKQ